MDELRKQIVEKFVSTYRSGRKVKRSEREGKDE